jgi:hypothetical protein
MMSSRDYHRQLSLEAFQQAHRQAMHARLWDKLARRPSQTLLPFEPIRAQLPRQSGVERRAQTIPLAQIAGSLDRWQEFDRDFRPLSKSLRDRWIGIAQLSQDAGWPPIRVHQLGNLYFVEDGHHRVSVARQLGFADIEAIVTEYPLPLAFDPHASLGEILEEIDRWKRDPVPLSSGVFIPTCY